MTDNTRSNHTDFPSPDDTFDAGQMGCGELIVKLNLRIKKMQPNQVLWLISLDNGAIEDIPAWCSVTGHRLLHGQHPNYYIARREE